MASSIVTLYFLELTDLFKPAKVGFQCYDRALSMPYVETNEEMIPLLMLLSLAFAAPAASVSAGTRIGSCLHGVGSGGHRSRVQRLYAEAGLAPAALCACPGSARLQGLGVRLGGARGRRVARATIRANGAQTLLLAGRR